MKKYIYLIALSMVFTAASAQQLQTSSLYDVQGVLHNPAMAGMQSSNFVGATYRSQWSGITGSPKTTNVFGSFAVPDKLIGLGGFIYSDVTGPTSRTGAQFSFAKHLPLSDGSGKFSIGIETRLFQFGIDKNKLGLALKGANDEMRNLFMSNMSERAAKLMRDEMAAMGPVKLKDVEAAQQEMVVVAKALADRGEIMLAESGGQDELIY
jgi:type IX secretion system PorP/SprF family membrane protein